MQHKDPLKFQLTVIGGPCRYSDNSFSSRSNITEGSEFMEKLCVPGGTAPSKGSLGGLEGFVGSPWRASVRSCSLWAICAGNICKTSPCRETASAISLSWGGGGGAWMFRLKLTDAVLVYTVTQKLDRWCFKHMCVHLARLICWPFYWRMVNNCLRWS